MNLDEIEGQHISITIIKNLLDNNKLPQSMVFYGPEGTGKFNTALGIAKYLNCTGSPKGNDNCNDCQRIENKNHPDLTVIDNDKKQIKIEQVRELLKYLALKSFENRNKIFIIMDAENLTEEAANCFLKSLEEPPPNNYIILISSKIEKMIPTILSRCLTVKFKTLNTGLIKNILVNKRDFSSSDADYFSSISGGSVSRAIDCFNSKDKLLNNFEYIKKSVCNGIKNKEVSFFIDFIDDIYEDRILVFTLLNLLLENLMKTFIKENNFRILGKIIELKHLIDKIKLPINLNLKLALEGFFISS